MKKHLLASLAIAGGAVVATAALAADVYSWKPTKPITIIVPWAAGGATDQMVRVVAGEIEKTLGTNVVVVNQPGASGSIGTKNVLAAAPDGYTWGSGAASDIGTYGVLGYIPDSGLDDWEIFLTVANVGVVAVPASSPYKDFGELLAAMKAKPGQVKFATAGVSSAGHINAELIAKATKLTYRHVPYEGGNPAVIATVGGETDVTTQLASEEAEMLRGKRLRALAVVGTKPFDLEGVGTIPPITNWIPGIKVPLNYFGIWIPKSAPSNVKQTMQRIWREKITTSQVVQNYAKQRGALFTPFYGVRAHEEALGMTSLNAWTQQAAGTAKVSPAKLGIPKP